ncbi:hypothetical protein UFOVP613_42 [uncultured Caudovirales phage]|uniref:Uncharacterized protein n=1 Tax=uncultured Caudovirales phage TaxID=2100421 RepID=A0A6J5N4K1_9CAUD|nr:hypothetical protein UFOVP613_42 [uncultured Caudovirales phage]
MGWKEPAGSARMRAHLQEARKRQKHYAGWHLHNTAPVSTARLILQAALGLLLVWGLLVLVFSAGAA